MPQAPVLRLANQLAVYPGTLAQYGRRAQTRSDHLGLVRRYLGWKAVPSGGEALKELEQFLLDRAMEYDTPSLLFHQGAEFLGSARTERPGVVVLMELVASARAAADELTTQKVDHLLTSRMRGDLDGLLVGDPLVGMTRLAWLTTPAVEASTAIRSSRSSSAAAYCFSSLAHIRVMAAMSSSSRGSTKYFFTDPSNVRLIVSAKCRPLLVKLMSDTRPSPWSALRWRCPASMRSWTSRDALVGLTLTSLPARARTD
jgi:hypothetical protein